MAEMSAYKDDILSVFQSVLPWEKLSGANILVTGSTGLIGGCFVEALMMNPRRCYSVYATGRCEKRARDRFADFFALEGFHFIKYDVTTPLTCDIKFDYIIHAASGAYPSEFVKHPVEIIKSNVIGVVNLMDYGRNHDLKRFLYISSGEVYGEGDGRVFTEDYSGYVNITSPRSCYPSSKRAAETLCVSYAHEYGVDVVMARPCHVFGPYFTESDNRVYAQFIRNILKGEDIIMKSTGEQYRSWCYVVDCVSALFHLLLKGDNCEAYNISDKFSNISIRGLAELMARIGNREVIIDIPDDEEKRGFNVVSRSVFSAEKLEALGWKPLNDTFETKMSHTIKELMR